MNLLLTLERSNRGTHTAVRTGAIATGSAGASNLAITAAPSPQEAVSLLNQSHTARNYPARPRGTGRCCRVSRVT